MVNGFRRLQIGRFNAGLFDHRPQFFGIFEHGTGPQHIFIEGLFIMIGHENRALEGVEQRRVVDIGIGIMNEIHMAPHRPLR